MFSCQLALGTVQFGLPYGVANQSGRAVSKEVAAAILSRAAAAGIDTLDTAISYGVSEATLGALGVRRWRVVSKLPQVPERCEDVGAWVRASIDDSLARLKIDQLYGLLLHHPRQLLGRDGAALAQALVSLRDSGRVKKIGISIYGPEELDAMLATMPIDLVQAPFNIVDRRLANSGWLAQLQYMEIEVHVRSIFFQGLLLMKAGHRPPFFARWQKLWDAWDQWLEANSLTALQGCLGFISSQSGIQRVIVGVESLEQLDEVLGSISDQTPLPPQQLENNDADLIDPSKWLVQ